MNKGGGTIHNENFPALICTEHQLKIQSKSNPEDIFEYIIIKVFIISNPIFQSMKK